MKIVLQPYQAAWAEMFQKERLQLEEAFAGLGIDFYHIGSTSIPGCSAKPTIDILGVTGDITAVDAYNEVMSKLRYEAKGEYGMPGRRFFQRKTVSPVHLHIFEDSNPEVERHLRFRDYLTRYPDKAAEYSQLKLRLAQEFPENINQYILGKEAWIKSIDIAAARESARPLAVKRHLPRKSQCTDHL